MILPPAFKKKKICQGLQRPSKLDRGFFRVKSRMLKSSFSFACKNLNSYCSCHLLLKLPLQPLPLNATPRITPTLVTKKNCQINRTYPTGNSVRNYQSFKVNVLEKKASIPLLCAYSQGALQSTGDGHQQPSWNEWQRGCS